MALPATEYLPLLNGITEKTEKGTEVLQGILARARTPNPDNTRPDELKNGYENLIVWDDAPLNNQIAYYKHCTLVRHLDGLRVYDKHLGIAETENQRPTIFIDSGDPELKDACRVLAVSVAGQQKIAHELSEIQALRSMMGEIE